MITFSNVKHNPLNFRYCYCGVIQVTWRLTEMRFLAGDGRGETENRGCVGGLPIRREKEPGSRWTRQGAEWSWRLLETVCLAESSAGKHEVNIRWSWRSSKYRLLKKKAQIWNTCRCVDSLWNVCFVVSDKRNLDLWLNLGKHLIK